MRSSLVRGAGAGSAVLCAVVLAGCSGPAPEAAPAGSAAASGPATSGSAVTTQGSPEPGDGPSSSPRPEPTVSQTPVPPPAGEGDLEPVPTAAVVTLPPAPLESPAAVGNGVEVRLAGLRPVRVTGRGPGQVSGPGVLVTVEVVNDGPEPLAVDGVAVSMAYSGTEAGPADGRGSEPLQGPVPAGGTASGTYVFVVPEDQRDAVTVRVVLASLSVAVFTGSATV